MSTIIIHLSPAGPIRGVSVLDYKAYTKPKLVFVIAFYKSSIQLTNNINILESVIDDLERYNSTDVLNYIAVNSWPENIRECKRSTSSRLSKDVVSDFREFIRKHKYDINNNKTFR